MGGEKRKLESFTDDELDTKIEHYEQKIEKAKSILKSRKYSQGLRKIKQHLLHPENKISDNARKWIDDWKDIRFFSDEEQRCEDTYKSTWQLKIVFERGRLEINHEHGGTSNCDWSRKELTVFDDNDKFVTWDLDHYYSRESPPDNSKNLADSLILLGLELSKEEFMAILEESIENIISFYDEDIINRFGSCFYVGFDYEIGKYFPGTQRR